MLAEKALTGSTAWTRLFEEQASAITVDLGEGGEPVSLDAALSRLFAADRDVRRDAAERVTAALEPGLRTRAYVLNTLLADKTVDDRLRNYPHWLASRNLSNEASDESVEALVSAVRSRYEVPRRWYRLKGRLLGIDRLADYDRMAAITEERRARRVAGRARPRARLLQRVLGRAGRARPAVLRRVVDRRARCGRTSAAARSAPTRSRPRTRTCSSTTRTSAATCSRSRTSWATACTPRSAPARACSTWPRR